MEGIKRYKVSYDSKFDMTVEVNHDVMTEAKLHEINNFWSEAAYRLSAEKGNITQAVLKLLAGHALPLTLETFHVIEKFNWKAGRGQDGWPAMDGSEGIKIVSIDQIVFDASDMDVEVL